MARRQPKGIITAEVVGIKDTDDRLKRLANRIQNKVLKKSVDAGAKVFRTALKQSAPRQTGLLRKSLGIKGKTYRGKNIYVAIIGPRTGFRGPVQLKIKVKGQRKKKVVTMIRDPIKYGHIVEALHPWMRPTFHANQAEASAVTMQTMTKEIDAAAKVKGA